MKSIEYLKTVKTYRNIDSDYQLAKYLGMTTGTVSNYMSGNRIMDNETCLKIADALDMTNPLPIIMAADLDRAERLGKRSYWEKISPKLFGGAATAALSYALVNNFVTANPEIARLAGRLTSTILTLC
ncbi:transcriptional regulator with XRE-family HTH domain [Robbsia andropogonis]|uniref:helix-turn-helix domain-containing protein n=1 Tax=Robbsia andropogonis TaxID=28092 RepID=UPI003D20C355